MHGIHRATEVDANDVRALLREAHRLCAADAASRAGDEGRLARQSAVHVVFWVRPASTTSWVPVM